jgi:hypothetical protein
MEITSVDNLATSSGGKFQFTLNQYNRTFALYLAVKEKAVPVQVPHLRLDTGTTSVEECVRSALGYLRGGKP